MASVYRDRLEAGGSGRDARASIAAIEALRATNEAFIRNPNETLQLQALLLRLGAAAERVP